MPSLHQPRLRPSPFMSPAAAAALDYFGRPDMPQQGFAFALYRDARGKPLVFPTLDALARRLHAERGGKPVEIRNETVDFNGADNVVVAAVHTLVDGQPDRLLGYAWLGGSKGARERLEVALDRLQPRRALLAH